MMGNKEATDAAFAKAAHKVTLRLVNNRISANSMETRGYIGDYSARRRLLHALYRDAESARRARHSCRPGVPCAGKPDPRHRQGCRRRLRHEGRRLSRRGAGAVGVEKDRPPGEVDLVAAPKACSTTRTAATRSSPARSRSTRTARSSGCARTASTNLGGNVSGAGVIPSLSALQMAPQVYRIPTVFFTGQAVFTNTAPMGPYRGAGRPEATYFMERLIEHAAPRDRHRPRRDPPPQFHPGERDALHDARPASSMTAAISPRPWIRPSPSADWNGYAARKAASEKTRQTARPRRSSTTSRPAASSTTAWNCASTRAVPSPSSPARSVTARAHATTFAQMVSEWLGVPFESIRFVQGDTNQVSFGRGTYGSRTSSVGGGALQGRVR